MVAAYENPMLRNLRVDLRRYPEIQQGAQDRRDGAGHGRARPTRSTRRCAPSGKRKASQVPTRSAHRAAVPAEGPAGRRVLPPDHRRRRAAQPRRTCQFAEQVIKAAVAALEKAYDLESAVIGQEQMKTWRRPTRSPTPSIAARWRTSWSRNWSAPTATTRC